MKWQKEIDLIDLWKQYADGSIDVMVLSEKIATRFSEIHFDDENDEAAFDEIIEEFRALAEDEDATEDDFNDLWSLFYDFADHEKKLWVKTQEWQR